MKIKHKNHKKNKPQNKGFSIDDLESMETESIVSIILKKHGKLVFMIIFYFITNLISILMCFYMFFKS